MRPYTLIPKRNIGEALPVFKGNEVYFSRLQADCDAERISCHHCGASLSVGACGKHISDGGDYKKHPYLRAKTSHRDGCEAAIKTNKGMKVNITSTREQKSMEDALKALMSDQVDSLEVDEEVVLPTKRKTPYSSSGKSSDSERVKPIRSLPLTVEKVHSNMKYKYRGKVTAKVSQNIDPLKPNNVELIFIDVKGLVLKVEASNGFYHIINNMSIDNNLKVNLNMGLVFMIENFDIEEKIKKKAYIGKKAIVGMIAEKERNK